MKRNGFHCESDRTGCSHTFHIPVMGTGFTVDTPIKVAKYGISSVISIVDDTLVERMRKYYCEKIGESFTPIADRDEDPRARRITTYLNLVNKIVAGQVTELRESPFEPGSEITRYYEMLPDTPKKEKYLAMLAATDPGEKARLQTELRKLAIPGSIDVNIMTKVDFDVYERGEKLPQEFSGAMSALRGFAKSDLRSSVVFSAGMNQHLYGYAAQFDDFFPDEDGRLGKKIILKVSDYRSALIQGKFLARKGLWVSEYRVESGLNCGGHAFATKGYLMGPILEEFKEKRSRLIESLWGAYEKALEERGCSVVQAPPDVRLTVQGGIGTACENQLMLEYYDFDGTGWATPFLLVPEVANVDAEHMRRLSDANDRDVYLSESSPLGVPFWVLRTSTSEEERCGKIAEGKPGSSCPKGYLASNSEFTKLPICTASHAYQKKKLESFSEETLTIEQQRRLEEGVVAKSCLCRDLSGGVDIKTGIEPEAMTTVCCGPNIVNFSKLASLEEMVGHIYGRLSLLTNPDRPHMFIKELSLYVDYLRKEIDKYSVDLSAHTPKYFTEFKENLLNGIEYYRNLAEEVVEEKRNSFLEELKALREELEATQMLVLA